MSPYRSCVRNSSRGLLAPQQQPQSTSSGFPPETKPAPQVDPQQVFREVGIVGESPAMRQVLEDIAAYAPEDLTVVVTGESGTGKELIAEAIHRLSPRKDQLFKPVHLAAGSLELIGSDLFGHEKGAFTGAGERRVGYFEQADGGTLFMDEIGEIDQQVQVKLLRVLQEGAFERLGGRDTIIVDVRVLAATNRNLEQLVAEGKFREDLYYRLCEATVCLPPLRERDGDIANIAQHFVAKFKNTKRLSVDAVERLQRHSWPGNVRELLSVLKRSCALCLKDELTADDLRFGKAVGVADDDWLKHLPNPRPGFLLPEFLKTARETLINRALHQTNGSPTRAAKLLGVTPQAVDNFMKRANTTTV